MDAIAPSIMPDALLRQHIAVLGMTGSGKTSTEKLIVEQVYDEGFRVCVLDTLKSDWWGITSSADGRKAGLPFTILGGPRGHVPLHSGAGKVIGQLVARGKLPHTVIDMADFEAGGLQRFFIEFAQALWKNARGVIYLVIEEAHELAPKERAGIGNENLALHWAKKLATGSRTKGIRLIVATQRTQSLHNAVRGSCGTLLAHRLVSPADQKPVVDWLKSNAKGPLAADISASLPELPDGNAWVCSSVASHFERIALPKFRTFDNNRTPDGDADEIKVKSAAVDQDQLRGLIGDAVKEAEAEDPARLKREIAELRKELAKKPAPALAKVVVDDKAIATAERGGFEAGLAEGRAEGWAAGYRKGCVVAAKSVSESIVGRLRDAIVDTTAYGAAFAADINIPSEPKWPRRRTPLAIATGAVADTPAASASVVKTRSVGKSTAIATIMVPLEGISGPQQTLLNALAWWDAAGHASPSRAMVAAVCGWNVTSGHLKNVAGSLKTGGLVEYPAAGQLALTDVGRQSAVAPEAALQQMLETLLSGPQRQVFDALASGPLDRGIIAERLGWNPTSGHLKNIVGSLKTLNVVVYPQQGVVERTEWTFA